MNLDSLTAYKLVKKEKLNDTVQPGYLFRHIKTGARVMAIENDDENKVFNIAFRTPAQKQHRCGSHSRTQCFVWIEGLSAERSFRRACKRLTEYVLKCNDLSGQDLLSCSKLQ